MYAMRINFLYIYKDKKVAETHGYKEGRRGNNIIGYDMIVFQLYRFS